MNINGLTNKAKNILVAWSAMVIILFITTTFLHIITPPDPWAGFFGNDDDSKPSLRLLIYLLFVGGVLAPIGEELVFRHFPLQMVKQYNLQKIQMPVILLSSIVFAWCHGGAINILIQGVGGLLLCWVYVRNGYHYWSSVIVHSMWNTFLYLGLVVYHI